MQLYCFQTVKRILDMKSNHKIPFWWMAILVPDCRAVSWGGGLLEANSQCYKEAVLFALLHQGCTQIESDTVTCMLL